MIIIAMAEGIPYPDGKVVTLEFDDKEHLKKSRNKKLLKIGFYLKHNVNFFLSKYLYFEP